MSIAHSFCVHKRKERPEGRSTFYPPVTSGESIPQKGVDHHFNVTRYYSTGD